MLVCAVCDQDFPRPCQSGRLPLFCSEAHRLEGRYARRRGNVKKRQAALVATWRAKT